MTDIVSFIDNMAPRINREIQTQRTEHFMSFGESPKRLQIDPVLWDMIIDYEFSRYRGFVTPLVGELFIDSSRTEELKTVYMGLAVELKENELQVLS